MCYILGPCCLVILFKKKSNLIYSECRKKKEKLMNISCVLGPLQIFSLNPQNRVSNDETELKEFKVPKVSDGTGFESRSTQYL